MGNKQTEWERPSNVWQNNHNKCMSNVQLQTSVTWSRKPGIWAKACDGLGGSEGGGACYLRAVSAHKQRQKERGRERDGTDRLCDWNFYARRRDLSLFNLLTYLTHIHTHARTHTLSNTHGQEWTSLALRLNTYSSNRERRERKGETEEGGSQIWCHYNKDRLEEVGGGTVDGQMWMLTTTGSELYHPTQSPTTCQILLRKSVKHQGRH